MNNLINITLSIIEKIVFIVASEKPSILRVISLQLIGFDSNNFSSFSLEMFSERFSAAVGIRSESHDSYSMTH